MALRDDFNSVPVWIKARICAVHGWGSWVIELGREDDANINGQSIPKSYLHDPATIFIKSSIYPRVPQKSPNKPRQILQKSNSPRKPDKQNSSRCPLILKILQQSCNNDQPTVSKSVHPQTVLKNPATTLQHLWSRRQAWNVSKQKPISSSTFCWI